MIKREGIKVEGHKGTWYVIDEGTLFDKKYYLLEHETYGDEAACICVDEDCKLVKEDLWNGLDEYLEELYDKGNWRLK